MTDISRHIEYLLLEHDRVSVPQLGTFSIQLTPSRWVEEEDLFLPPVRNVSFTSACDDASSDHFIRSLATALKVTYEHAQTICAEYVDGIRQELSTNSVAEVGSIGMFVRDSSVDTDCFIPCQAGVTSPQFYGLDSVYQPRLTESVIQSEKVSSASAKAQSDSNHVTIRIPRTLLYYAASAAAAIVIFLSLSTPATFTSPESATEVATTNLFLPHNLLPSDQPIHQLWQTDAPEAQPADTANLSSAQHQAEAVSDVSVSEEKQDKTVTPSTSMDKPVEVHAPKESLDEDGYAVVLASAVSLSNAERYVTDLNKKGIQAVIRSNGSMNRVLVPGFASKDKAAEYASMLRTKDAEFESVWVLKL